MINIGFLGTSYKYRELIELELIYLTKEEIKVFLNRITTTSPLDACVPIMTCNRVEFYFSSNNIDAANKWIVEELSSLKKIEQKKVKAILRKKKGDEVIHHLFEVASGIKSMVFGEAEILAQIKDFYQFSLNEKKTKALLNKCFQTAIATGKRVREETAISRGAASISSIAIEAIRTKILDYFGKKILIIGAGTMSRRAIKKLAALGHPDTTISNRTAAKAIKLAEDDGLTTLSFDELKNVIWDYEIIIVALAIKDPFINSDLLNNNTKRKHTELLIDLGLPRNVSKNVTEKIETITIQGLKDIAEKNIDRRKAELSKIQLIITEEKDGLVKWQAYRDKATKK